MITNDCNLQQFSAEYPGLKQPVSETIFNSIDLHYDGTEGKIQQIINLLSSFLFSYKIY